MKKLFTPTVVGTLVGLVVTFVFVWGYATITTFVGANKPIRSTEAELPARFQEYCSEKLGDSGSYSLPTAPQQGSPCCFLYGFYTENGRDYPYAALVARQLFKEDYLIREDMIGFSREETSAGDHVWRGSGEITANGYILFKYTAHYEIDENGATVTYERNIKLLDLISVCLLFTFADIAGRGFRKSKLKRIAEGKDGKA